MNSESTTADSNVHLNPEVSDRGFDFYPEIEVPYILPGESVYISQSSSATQDAMWLRVSGAVTPMDENHLITGPSVLTEVALHMPYHKARQLAEQILRLTSE